MPTKREREYYRMGFTDGRKFEREGFEESDRGIAQFTRPAKETMLRQLESGFGTIRKPKRKLSAWNKFVKANSKKKIYRFANGKLKLKKMGIAFRKTRAGRKK